MKTLMIGLTLLSLAVSPLAAQDTAPAEPVTSTPVSPAGAQYDPNCMRQQSAKMAKYLAAYVLRRGVQAAYEGVWVGNWDQARETVVGTASGDSLKSMVAFTLGARLAEKTGYRMYAGEAPVANAFKGGLKIDELLAKAKTAGGKIGKLGTGISVLAKGVGRFGWPAYPLVFGTLASDVFVHDKSVNVPETMVRAAAYPLAWSAANMVTQAEWGTLLRGQDNLQKILGMLRKRPPTLKLIAETAPSGWFMTATKLATTMALTDLFMSKSDKIAGWLPKSESDDDPAEVKRPIKRKETDSNKD